MHFSNTALWNGAIRPESLSLPVATPGVVPWSLRRTLRTVSSPPDRMSSPLERALRLALVLSLGYLVAAQGGPPPPAATDPAFAEAFDTHWENLRDRYPYFELYGVDWEAERDEHRPRALAAANQDEFAWELARLFGALPDPHVSFLPSMATVQGRWSAPDVEVEFIARRPYVVRWPVGDEPEAPEAFADHPRAYPEIVAIQGAPMSTAAEILAAGPVGTTTELRLAWPDGSETDHVLRRPETPNLPPPKEHFGTRWLVAGRVGSIGYMGVRTFSPDRATLGADGKITTMLRAALRELLDTDGLVLDLQGNGGGLVAASDPFLGNLVERRLSYAWGNSGGQERVIRPRTPGYRGRIVALVDGRSASGGEWAARILRDAGRAVVVGERTVGAEAGVKSSQAPDGSVVRYSAWPMVEPGVEPFQEVGVEPDHDIPLTVEDARELGYEEAVARVRRARFAKALELLGAPAADLDELLELADTGPETDERGSGAR